jgi:hypothetical protein
MIAMWTTRGNQAFARLLLTKMACSCFKTTHLGAGKPVALLDFAAMVW